VAPVGILPDVPRSDVQGMLLVAPEQVRPGTEIAKRGDPDPHPAALSLVSVAP
jgi:hypothetical protein